MNTDAGTFPPAMTDALRALYSELEGEIRAANPLCTQRGACCNFTKTDHRLYATEVEIAWLLEHHALPPTAAGGDEVCPFLQDNRCSIREHRMLGCRIYYCDTTYTTHGTALYEKYLSRIKALYREHGMDYRYVDAMRRFRELAGK